MPRFPASASHLHAIPAAAYSALAGRLARHPGETYPLHVGDTWMEPAERCRMEDLTVAAHPGMHRYAPVQGLPALVDAVLERERELTGLPLEREQVLITAGATGGLAAVIGALVEPGDEVLILAPYWPLIEGIVRAFHGRPVAVPVLAGEAGSAAEAVAAAARGLSRRTVALYLSSPNNPSGRLLPRDWIESLVAWAGEHGLWVITDEAYERFVYAGEHVPALPLAPERTFLAQTFSKGYGMAGNRCGYIVGPQEVMTEVRKVSTHAFYAAPTAAQLAAARALAGPGEAWAATARELYGATARRAAARLGLPAPEGSTFLFFDVAPALDERGLAGLLERAADRGLLVAPGASFGPYPTWVRLCYTSVEPERALRGVEILAGLLGR